MKINSEKVSNIKIMKNIFYVINTDGFFDDLWIKNQYIYTT